LEIYNKRLDERIKRKNFVIDRGLLDLKKQNHLDRTRSAEEKEIYNVMKIFARFQSEEEHEKLVQNIVRERALRRRIEELKAYRQLNLKTFDEVEVRPTHAALPARKAQERRAVQQEDRDAQKHLPAGDQVQQAHQQGQQGRGRAARHQKLLHRTREPPLRARRPQAPRVPADQRNPRPRVHLAGLPLARLREPDLRLEADRKAQDHGRLRLPREPRPRPRAVIIIGYL